MKKTEFRRLIREEIELFKEANPVKGKKSYYTMDNIGSSKYSVNYYDGKDTHKDGSPFYNIALFKNKKKYNAFIKDLTKKGYVAESLQTEASEPVVTFKDYENRKVTHIGNHFVTDVNIKQGYIDLESDLFIDLGELEEEDFTDIVGAEKIWSQTEKKLNGTVVNGQTKNGVKYQLYATWDGSGLSYWLGDGIAIRITIAPKKDNFELTQDEVKALSKTIEKYIAKLTRIVKKAMRAIDKLHDGDSIMVYS